MATLVTADINWDHSSDAGFQAWTSAIISAMQTVNPALLVQTADSGQFNPTGAVRPAAGVLTDYVVFKFDDGIGLPLYLKLTFTTGNNGATVPAMRVAIGKGTDGAGNLTGVLWGDGTGSGASNLQVGPIMASVVPGAITFMFGYKPINYTALYAFHVSRSSDDNGNYNGDGIYVLRQTYGSATPTVVTAPWNLTATLTTTVSAYTVASVYDKTTLSIGGVVKPFPVYYLAPDVRVANGIVSMFSTDIAAGTEFSLAMLGSTPRNYKHLGFTGNGGIALPVIWE